MNEITMQLNADKLIRMALQEDITSEDITTNAVMPGARKGEVQLICKQDGIVAGLGIFSRVFELLDDSVEIDLKCQDGDVVKEGQLMAVLTGDIRVKLSPADEWHRHLYRFHRHAFRGLEDKASRYPQNDTQHAGV